MPTGPQGQRRPADVIGGAIRVAKIATGEIEEKLTPKSGRTRSGQAGARARREALTAEQRAEISKLAAQTRWDK